MCHTNQGISWCGRRLLCRFGPPCFGWAHNPTCKLAYSERPECTPSWHGCSIAHISASDTAQCALLTMAQPGGMRSVAPLTTIPVVVLNKDTFWCFLGLYSLL
jgi:hypothetical protein